MGLTATLCAQHVARGASGLARATFRRALPDVLDISPSALEGGLSLVMPPLASVGRELAPVAMPICPMN